MILKCDKRLFFFVKLNNRLNFRFKSFSLFLLSKKEIFSNKLRTFNFGILFSWNLNKLLQQNYSYFFFILVIKNLIKVFYRRYRTVILRRRLFRVIGNYRQLIIKWSQLTYNDINGRFWLPLIFGSRDQYKSFKRNEWLFLLRSGVEKRTFKTNLNLYYDFLRKVVRYFPKRRLLLLNKIFVCRLRATRNNFFLTFYFTNGKALVTSSAGLVGFKGKKKRTPLAAKKAATFFSKKVFFCLKKLRVNIKNSFFIIKIYGKASSSVFKEALVGLRNSKFPCNLLVDSKTVSHSRGVRLKKPRRV